MAHNPVNDSRSVNAHNLRGCGHVCVIVHGSGDELEWLFPMIDESTPQPVRTVRIVDQDQASGETSRLEAWRTEHPPIAGRGEMRLTDWQHTYLAGGEFQQRAMLSRIDGIVEDGHEDGFPLVRIVADMAWAAGDVIGVGDLFAYESRLNTLIDPTDTLVMCVYDLSAFSRGVMGGLTHRSSSLGAGFLLDVIRAHPFVVSDKQLRANRFYAPPESFLPEIAGRRGPGSAP